MPPLIDLIGKTFGRLTVIIRTANDKFGHSMWLCRCDCGKKRIVVGHSLTNLTTKSCGCLNVEKIIQRSTSHGHAQRNKMSKTYKSWSGLVQRCTNKKDKVYNRYGGRGITVCKRWRKFENFLEDMGDKPTNKHQIDRINNNGNYCKLNCRWTLSKINNRNKRNNHLITYRNKTQCVSTWADETGIKQANILKRLRLGWSVYKTLTTSVRKHKRRKK